MPLGSASLSASEARHIALAAQGLSRPKRNGTANWTRIENAIERMNLLQIDSVNVLVRSHYLPVFSRVGHYDRAALDKRTFSNRKRRMFEYWAHEASLLPLELYPLMRWRMDRAAKGNGVYNSLARFARDNRKYVTGTLDHIRKNGATTVSKLADPGKRIGGWWGWSKGKLALEYLFDIGAVTTASRPNFERTYDLPERVIPAEFLNIQAPGERDATRELIDLSGRALGIATDADLRDYFRLPVDAFKIALPALIEDGRLRSVTVDGWKQKAYLHKDAALPRKIEGAALLSPFDPMVWERSRAERLFDFHYRIEIYTPAHKRRYGYYVLPFLLDGQIVARVCLKSDRQAKALRVNTAHLEGHADPSQAAETLARELSLMARWLGLERIDIRERGDLAPMLRQALSNS